MSFIITLSAACSSSGIIIMINSKIVIIILIAWSLVNSIFQVTAVYATLINY